VDQAELGARGGIKAKDKRKKGSEVHISKVLGTRYIVYSSGFGSSLVHGYFKRFVNR